MKGKIGDWFLVVIEVLGILGIICIAVFHITTLDIEVLGQWEYLFQFILSIIVMLWAIELIPMTIKLMKGTDKNER